MTRAFAWLIARTMRNRFARQLQRARQPRYALPMLLGLLYAWAVFISPSRRPPLAGAAANGTAHLGFAAALALLVAWWWLLGNEHPSLPFTPAEVQLLFPAPVTRRQLVGLKLVQAQWAVLVSTGVWLILLGPGGVPLVLRALALWVLFTTLHLHHTAASLVRAGAAEHGRAGVRRNAWALVLFAIALTVTAIAVARALPALRDALATGGALAAAGALLHAPGVMLVLTPFRLMLAPAFASTTAEWARAMLPAVAIMAAHYLWVLRSDVAFEESAAEAAARRAALRAARAQRGAPEPRRGRVRVPLPPRGHPAMAIAWKNVVAFTRTIRPASVVVLILAAVAGFSIASTEALGARGGAWFIGTMALAFAGALVVLGPTWVRNDLRLDMLRLELLRALPLRGAALVRAELAGSALTLTAMQLALGLIALLVLPATDAPLLAPGERGAAALAAIVALPVVNCAGLLVQNGAALLFPDWVRLGLTRATGVEAMGQNILTSLGAMLALGILAAVPVALGAVVAVLTLDRLGVWAIPLAALGGALTLAAELWALTAWLGRAFDRTEPLVTESTM